MIKTKKNCSVCQTILSQPKKWEGRLAKLIYESRFYMHGSNYTLRDVWKQYDGSFSYESLLNHAKKHQALSEADLNDRQLRVVTNDLRKKQINQAIKSTEVWDSVISKGMKDLEDGKMNLSPTHLLAAARDKSNFELKHADQQIALMDMVFGFASGEGLPPGVREDGDEFIEGEVATEGVAADNQSREERSRAVLDRIARGAAAPGSD